MLLRTRLTLMVVLGLVLLATGLGAAGLLREQLLHQRLAANLQAGQATQWQQALATQQRALERQQDRLLAQDSFWRAARHLDASALESLLAQLRNTAPAEPAPVLLALLPSGREPVIAGPHPARALLDGASLERAFTGEAIGGLRLLGEGRALLLSARRLPQHPEPVLLVLAHDANQVLAELAQQGQVAASLLDLRGRLLASTDERLWQEAAPHVALRTAEQRELRLDRRHYSAVSLPVRDLAGHNTGTLVTLSEHSLEARASRFLGLLALGGTLALLLAIALGLNLYLRARLRPLEQAIDALQALAQGDTRVHLPHSGDDEIGRIGQAVTRFRHAMQELMATRALRERVRRRQERLLHQRLQELAQATHQRLILDSSHNEEEQLRQLAQVMDQLSARLIDQHQRLSGMVQELREALITKDRLAGLEQELQIAAQVQLSILPQQAPQDQRLQLHCQIIPAREVGGDFYDYFFIGPDQLGFVMADVSGKGVPAALFMTITRTLLKATAQFIAQPTACMAYLNQLLAAENEQMMFVTLFYGVLDLRTGRIDYVNAGHNPPYVLHADGRLESVPRTGGMAVAIIEDAPYRSAHITLEPGAQLFLYTDGVTEAMNTEHQEYGETRLEQLLAGPEPRSPQALNAAVVADVHRFEVGAPQADDITCMTLRYCGSAPST